MSAGERHPERGRNAHQIVLFLLRTRPLLDYPVSACWPPVFNTFEYRHPQLQHPRLHLPVSCVLINVA